MKKLISISLFVLILQFAAFAQNNTFNLGLELAKSGDFQNALPHFQNAFEKNLSNKKIAQIHYNIGVCFYQLKQFDKAIAEFEQAVSLKKDYEKAFYALGMAYTDSQNWTKAEAAFRQTIKLSNGRNGEAWFDLGFVYVEQKNYDEAFTSFQKAIDFGSRAIPASHNNLGVIYAIKGNLPMANKEIETAKTLGFNGAQSNLEVLRQLTASNDKSLIANLIFKE